jgi:hexosaminidase
MYILNKWLFLSMILICSLSGKSQSVTYPLVPLPNSLIEKAGEFELTKSTKIYLQKETADLKQSIEFFNNLLKQSAGFELNYTSKANKNVIAFYEDLAITNNEGYELEVNPTHITIKYKTSTGAFYALQTLRQLVSSEIEGKSIMKSFIVPAVEIKDAPRFAYRGFMLDVARHFQPLEVVKKYIDLLAFYKINTLHFHLTDDQGWRIEIKKYPKLQQIAAWRKETRVGHRRDSLEIYDGIPHGGYYTQNELKDLVSYAKKRSITIIPEIELPGHSHAVLAAYPELGCRDTTYQVSTNWGVHPDVYCPNEVTFTFLKDVLSEVIEIFPSKYIHIGGDEVPKDRWKASAYSQELIKKHNLVDENGLQSYFIKQIEDFLRTKGRSIIGWDEMLDGGVSDNATIMTWHVGKVGVAASNGNKEIMTTNSHLYFDYYQTKDGRKREPVAIGNYLPLKKVYSYEPIPENLAPEHQKNIIGVQANLWTEYISTPSHIDNMTFPRLCALSEIAWSQPQKKKYADFLLRLNQNLKHLEKLEVNFSKYHLEEIP